MRRPKSWHAARIAATARPASSGVSRPASHPVPIRAVRRTAARLDPPIHKGRSGCTGSGEMLAFRYRKNSPSVVTRSPRQRAAMMSSASSTIRPRPSVGRPVAFQSGPRVLPIPNAGRRRPSLRKSMVAHCLARRSGSRSPTDATFIPNLMRRVAPASIAIALMHSRMGRRDTIRSVCQRESTPPSSQRSTHRRKAAPEENGSSMRPRPTPIVIVRSFACDSAHSCSIKPLRNPAGRIGACSRQRDASTVSAKSGRSD